MKSTQMGDFEKLHAINIFFCSIAYLLMVWRENEENTGSLIEKIYHFAMTIRGAEQRGYQNDPEKNSISACGRIAGFLIRIRRD